MSQPVTTQPPGLRVVVVGGGITGLSAAYYLQQEEICRNRAVSITLIETSQRLGGKLITDQVGEFTVEGGPDSFLRQKPWAAELANSLGLQADLIGTNDYQHKTYVLNHGRLTPLPDGVMLIIPTRLMPFMLSPLISWPGKLRMGMDWFIPRKQDTGDETVAAFVQRRLGSEALEKIAEPLLSGIHVSLPEKQSLLATFPRFRTTEQKHGSLIRGMLAEKKAAAQKRSADEKPASAFLSFKQGVGHLPQALEAALTGCSIRKGVRVVAIQRRPDGGYKVGLSSGEEVSADAVILTTPAFAAGELLEPLSPVTASLLNSIEYVSTATISLAFRQQDIRKPFRGFGFVIPRMEQRRISACTWSSFKFEHRAPEGSLLLRCFVGGPGKEAMVDLEDAELIKIAREELASILEVQAEPIFTRVYRWRKANPQYNLGHIDLIQKIFAACREQIPGILLCGSAYEGVGIPDCVHQGKKAAEAVAEYLRFAMV
jgi:protoporphyrinogen/coproporphyrinogen III oxidase